jgi:hypothetical protein
MADKGTILTKELQFDGIFFDYYLDDSGSVIVKSDRNLLIDGSEGEFNELFEVTSSHHQEKLSHLEKKFPRDRLKIFKLDAQTSTKSSAPMCTACSSDSSDSSISAIFKDSKFSSIDKGILLGNRERTIECYHSESIDYSISDGSFVHPNHPCIQRGSETSDDDVYIEDDNFSEYELLEIIIPPDVIELRNDLDLSCSSFFDEEVVEM